MGDIIKKGSDFLLHGHHSSDRRATIAAIASTLLKFSGMISVAGMEMSNSSFSAPMSWMISSEERMPSSIRVSQVSKSTSSPMSSRISRMELHLSHLPWLMGTMVIQNLLRT